MSANVRPIWENADTSEAEQRIARAVVDSGRFDCDGAFKMWRAYVLDFAFQRGRVVGFYGECKDRTENERQKGLPFGYGDGYYLSVLKVIGARRLMETCQGRGRFLFVRFRDQRIRYAPIMPSYRDVIICGRKDRPDDPNAEEPHVIIDWSWFVEL